MTIGRSRLDPAEPVRSTCVGRGWIDVLGLVVLLVAGVYVGLALVASETTPVDADMVWRVGQSPHYYGATWSAAADSRYVYPPVLAQATGTLSPVGWPVFIVVWQAVVFGALWLALREWALLVFGVSLVSAIVAGFDSPLAAPFALMMVGNVQSLVAAAIVVGFRHPAAWAFVLLTKIGPGIGLLWFAARAEWRALAIALGTTGAIVLVSFSLAPGAWVEFTRFAISNVNATSPEPVLPIPLLVRLPLCAISIVWAGRNDQRWVVPIACGFGALALYTWTWLTLAVAALPLLADQWRETREPAIAP